MAAGSLLVGLHMAATHGVTLGMMSSAIPSGTVPGIGRVSGTAWSFTDLVLGARQPRGHPRKMTVTPGIQGRLGISI